jgi:hypothetical protein
MTDIQLIQDGNDLEGAKGVFHYMGYKRVVMLDSDLSHTSDFEKKARDFAERFDFSLEHLDCRTTLLEEAYARAKEYMYNDVRVPGWETPPEPTPLR